MKVKIDLLYFKGFPSPIILVNGTDVATGLKSVPGSSACKIDGIPETAKIIENIKGAKLPQS